MTEDDTYLSIKILLYSGNPIHADLMDVVGFVLDATSYERR
jgi:hypothetical protein